MKQALFVAFCLAGCTHAPPPAAPHPSANPPPPPDEPHAAPAMCVTHGALRGQRVEEPAMRAFVRGSQGDSATLAFTYDGPTQTVSHLASGDVREQLGLKLRAEDGCNLVYVMWRFAPKPEIVVQVKRNPGQRTNAECGTNGYERIKPTHHDKVPAPEPSSAHTLAATIAGDELTARVDGNVVWQGTLPASARDLHGPIGVRSDNVVASLQLTGPMAERDDNERCKARGAD